MTDLPDLPRRPELPRRYGEHEVARILKRATEIKQESPARGLGGDGLTLQELEEIAAEAGIDVSHLRRAALELDTGELDSGFLTGLVGEQLSVVMESTVEGELPDAGFEQVVVTIQAATREHGQPSLLGRTLTWRAETPGKTRTAQVTVSVRRGETHIRIEENLHQMAGALHGGIDAGAGLGIGLGFGIPMATLTGSVLLGVAFPLGVLGLSYMTAREIYRVVVRRRRKSVTDLLARLTEVVRDEIERGG